VCEADIIYSDPKQGRLQRLSVDFARSARALCLALWKAEFAERSSIDQLYRAALSVGANVREAQYAESPKDFIHKLKIAEKELGEFYYWLGVLSSEPVIIKAEHLDGIRNMALQVKKLLATIITTMKLKHRNS
jgi:four helix bundle protein